MERILVALDSSEAAKLVVAKATELARGTGAKLRLVHAIAVQPMAMAHGMFGAPLVAPPSLLFEEATKALRELLGDVPEVFRDGIVVQPGDAADVICEEARLYDADIVVIGAHRYGMFERVLGTTAAKVVNRLDRPVLVVRPRGGKSAKTSASAALRREHALLGSVYDALIAAYSGGDWCDVRKEWDVFERVIRAHMELEETRILPKFRETDPREADAILREHAEIRGLLGTLGVDVDLHVASRDMIATLIGRVRAHAAREELLFYPWIDWEIDAEELGTAFPTNGVEASPSAHANPA